MGNIMHLMGFPGGSDGKESACSAGDTGSIPGSGRSPGERNGYPLQYSCLEKSMGREAWQATVHGVAKKTEQLTHKSKDKKTPAEGNGNPLHYS